MCLDKAIVAHILQLFKKRLGGITNVLFISLKIENRMLDLFGFFSCLPFFLSFCLPNLNL